MHRKLRDPYAAVLLCLVTHMYQIGGRRGAVCACFFDASKTAWFISKRFFIFVSVSRSVVGWRQSRRLLEYAVEVSHTSKTAVKGDTGDLFVSAEHFFRFFYAHSGDEA